MTAHDVAFSGCRVTTAGVTLTAEYRVADAFRLGDRVIVLYDPRVYTRPTGQFHNLVALALDGKQLWTSELPTNSSGDRYYQIDSREPLLVDSYSSYSCEIDPDTGKIVSKEFHK